ncbi:MAG: Uma2 family endonuclease [Anaerolineae bacterium]|nr:Uma2 family endonuclease [Anaerolineae bacterium]
MLVKEQHYTAQELWDIAMLPENVDKRLELIEGEIKEKMAASFIPSVIAGVILGEIYAYLKSNPIGHVTTSDGSYELSETDTFMPDVAFIRKERLPELPEHYVKVPPDLAVEVVSPTDVYQDVHLKAMRYISLGTALVWVVYPARKMINVYRPAEEGANVQTVALDGVLSGGDILPGFQLAATDVFSVLG